MYGVDLFPYSQACISTTHFIGEWNICNTKLYGTVMISVLLSIITTAYISNTEMYVILISIAYL